MNGLGTALLAAAGGYGVVAGAAFRLSSIRRLGGAYAPFGLLAAALAGSCLGGFVRATADSANGAFIGQCMESTFVGVGFVAWVHFIYARLERPLPRAARVLTAIAWLTSLLGASGFLLDPAHSAAPSHVFGPGLVPAVYTSPLGKVVTVVGIVAFVIVGWDVRRANGPAWLRGTLWSTLMAAAVLWAFRSAMVLLDRPVGPWFGLLLLPFFSVAAVGLLQQWVHIDETLARRTQELEASYERLSDAQMELVRREQLAAVGELSAVIAHEVRNPLAVLKNAVSGLRREQLTPELRETLHDILDDETDRLNRLVRDLLAYARPITVVQTDTDVHALLTRVADHARARRPGQVEVSLHLGAAERIRADPDQLERAILQLVDNALDAMPHDGTLRLSVDELVERGARYAALRVEDSGEGMDTLVRQRAKEPFFTTRKQGTGLGLAIVERIVAAHRGRLELASNADGGTTATVIVPEAGVTVRAPLV